MRRIIATTAALVMSLGILGIVPAQATHCAPGAIQSCPDPVTVIAIEGIGNVCSKAVLTVAEAALYGSKCTYNYNDPSWVSKSASKWNAPGGADGSKYQGLFWPGVGPGSVGPYSLRISGSAAPPNNACVSNIGGQNCSSDSVGKLTPGSPSGLGAFCGSSKGTGSISFRAADGSLTTKGTSGWDQSAATILPLYGEITSGTRNGVPFVYPAGARPSLRGFTSSRGIGGSGNCGIVDPTTGFQVEGMVVTF